VHKASKIRQPVVVAGSFEEILSRSRLEKKRFSNEKTFLLTLERLKIGTNNGQNLSDAWK
jgi:hypothetical protein